MRFETLEYEVDAGVAVIRLNRPARKNAVNRQMSRELPTLWRMFERDQSAAVAIVTAAGDDAFCTGADLADLPEMLFDEDGAPSIDSIRWTSLQNDVWKPVICAVNGVVLGGGLHFLADSDFVLAADHAWLSDTHVSVGLVSALELTPLARRMPMGEVLRLALVGRDARMTAQRAHQLGLVSELCATQDLLARAKTLALSIAKNSPSAMARTKRAVWRSKELGLQDSLRKSWADIVEHNQGPDFEEGVRAFIEKREPRWAPYGGQP